MIAVGEAHLHHTFSYMPTHFPTHSHMVTHLVRAQLPSDAVVLSVPCNPQRGPVALGRYTQRYGSLYQLLDVD